MVHNSVGMHHFQKRKSAEEPYPSAHWFKKLVDDGIYFVGFVGILMTLPQVYLIWVGKNASGVSAISWAWYIVGSLFWVVYGILHKERAIIITNILWALLNTLVVVGAILYS